MDNKQEDPIKLELDVILAEIKKGKEDTGRPLKLNLETYKRFLYFYRRTRMKVWSAAQAQIGKPAYDRIVAQSETFRGVLERDDQDMKSLAMMNIYKDIQGYPEWEEEVVVYDKEVKERVIKKITHREIPGNVLTSQWVVTNLYKEKSDEPEAPSLGAPQNEEQAKLMAEMLNWHYEYRKQREANQSKGATS